MPTFSARTPIAAPAAALFDWHERPGAFRRLSPPWQTVEMRRFEGIRTGDVAEFALRAGPAAVTWVAEHHAYTDACRRGEGVCSFTDIQRQGPFAAWTHRHDMVPAGDASVLHDEVQYTLPLAPLSRPARGFAEGEIERMFGYRHRVTAADLARHQAWAGGGLTVAVTGASGLLGDALASFLTTGGHRVVRLVRSREAAAADPGRGLERRVYWNVEDGEIDTAALAALAPDAAVHLAGEPVYGFPWTTDKKRRIWESRTKGTLLFSRALAALPTPPRVLLSASASGIYGDTGALPVNESSPTGDGFLADVCRAWEAATAPAEDASIRTVHLRIGLVLSPAGGMLGTLGPLASLGLGGWPGSGDAFWPWIALDDVLYAMHHLLGADVRGPVNIAAPAPSTARATVKALGRALRRPAVLRAPAPLLRTLGGEAARELALKSVRMIPARLRESGYRYAYPTLDGALGHLYGRAPFPSASQVTALAS